MNRIDRTFKQLKKSGEKAFVAYITAGDPDMDKTEEYIYTLEEAGTDIIELGIPFSDPLADGPTLQEAAQRALKKGATVDKIIDLVRKVRQKTSIPLIFLVYINTILTYGKEKFVESCVEAGVDGLIIPDLPYEEKDELKDVLDKTTLALIPLVAPTSKDRIKTILNGAKGFVYCVSNTGVTGSSSSFHQSIDSYLHYVKSCTDLPIAVGFGITHKKDVIKMNALSDGVIVGSAIVRQIHKDSTQLGTFVKQLIAK